MSAVAQEVYLAEHLQWEKDQWDLCGRSNDSLILCINANELRISMEEARLAANYYDMTAEEREEFDSSYEADAVEEISSLTAAWISDNAPAA